MLQVIRNKCKDKTETMSVQLNSLYNIVFNKAPDVSTTGNNHDPNKAIKFLVTVVGLQIVL